MLVRMWKRAMLQEAYSKAHHTMQHEANKNKNVQLWLQPCNCKMSCSVFIFFLQFGMASIICSCTMKRSKAPWNWNKVHCKHPNCYHWCNLSWNVCIYIFIYTLSSVWQATWCSQGIYCQWNAHAAWILFLQFVQGESQFVLAFGEAFAAHSHGKHQLLYGNTCVVYLLLSCNILAVEQV